MVSASQEQGGVDAVQARQHLSRILASAIFQRSPLQSAFLRLVVEKALAREADQINECEIAVQVYGKPADPAASSYPIVRNEAARLRLNLREYYASEGRREEYRIYLPKGGYVPKFRAAPRATGPDAASKVAAVPAEERVRPPVWLVPAVVAAVVAVVVVLVALIWALGIHRTGSPLILPNTKIPASIAVLPIREGKSVGSDLHLGEALTQALVAEMSQTGFPPWRQRTVVKRGDGAPQSDAAAVLRGSLSVDGSVARVSCSLEHTASQVALWNGVIERKLADWPESQRGAMLEDMAYAVSEELNIALMERMEQELAVLYPPRAAARRNWQDAEELRRRGDESSVRQAILLMERAAALDPNFAWNHASLAQTYVRALELGIVPDELYRKRAHEEAARALELGPYLPFAHAASARVALALDWNVRGASAACTSALNILSAASTVRRQCAEIYSLNGRGDAAVALDERSVRRFKGEAFPLAGLAWVHYRARQFEEARRLARESLEVDPTYVPARRVLVLAGLSVGDMQVAIATAREGLADRTGRINAVAATAFALVGDLQNAQAQVTKARERLRRPYQTDLIRPYLALRQGSRAATLIDEGVTQLNPNLLDLLADPQIADLDREGLFEHVRGKLRN